jgi:general secretion pathway protein G
MLLSGKARSAERPSANDGTSVVARRPRRVEVRRAFHARKRRPGFTIIEMLLVVAILGTLATLATPYLQAAVDQARNTRAIGELRKIVVEIQLYQMNNMGQSPNSLADIGMDGMKDPWGRPYVYLKFPTGGGGGGRAGGGGGGGAPAGARKDRFLVPINSAFDLYSMGKDGSSTAPLTASNSQDDIVVANDGGFVGVAADF